MDMKDRKAIARKIEEHIATLVDYDVIRAQVGDTLSEYVWAMILGEEFEKKQKLASVKNLGDNNEIHSLGPTVLKRNWQTSKEDSSRS
jgi:hypothetical protein